jgi:DUF4097 and DUF4098 domain-containing protein YvlB
MVTIFRYRPALGVLALGVCASLVSASRGRAQPTYDFHQTLTVRPSEPVVLSVGLARGSLQVLYGRDGQVSITAYGMASDGGKLDASYLTSMVAVEQNGNRIQVRDVPKPDGMGARNTVHYRIDVPYRTEVTSKVDRGSQTFRGIMGPVKAESGNGDITASYLSKGLQAQAENGNLEMEVIGERVTAKTRNGNISCVRLPQGVSAETGDGDITLTVVGASTAAITSGVGRIEVTGARSSFEGSTQGGDLNVKAELRGDWRLHSVSGNVRIALPPAQKADLVASTDSGSFQMDRDDVAKPQPEARTTMQKLNGGGPRIDIHTGSGKILIR